jgi:hypothetical protein
MAFTGSSGNDSIADRHIDYARQVARELKQAGYGLLWMNDGAHECQNSGCSKPKDPLYAGNRR